MFVLTLGLGLGLGRYNVMWDTFLDHISILQRKKQLFWDEIYYQILDLWWVCPGFDSLETTDIPTQHDGFVFKNIVFDPRDHNKHIPDEICFRMMPYKSYPEPHFALSRI